MTVRAVAPSVTAAKVMSTVFLVVHSPLGLVQWNIAISMGVGLALVLSNLSYIGTVLVNGIAR